jgi:hypothetical protein
MASSRDIGIFTLRYNYCPALLAFCAADKDKKTMNPGGF